MQRTGFSFERVVIEPLKGVWHKIFDLRFFHESASPWPLSILLGAISKFLWKILAGIFNFVFIAGVNDTGGRIIAGVVDNDNKALFWIFIKSVTLVINLSPVTTTLGIIYRQCQQTLGMRNTCNKISLPTPQSDY